MVVLKTNRPEFQNYSVVLPIVGEVKIIKGKLEVEDRKQAEELMKAASFMGFEFAESKGSESGDANSQNGTQSGDQGKDSKGKKK